MQQIKDPKSDVIFDLEKSTILVMRIKIGLTCYFLLKDDDWLKTCQQNEIHDINLVGWRGNPVFH